jgi:hypothetical protein
MGILHKYLVTVESFAKVSDKTPNYTANCNRD